MAYLYNRILSSFKKEGNSDIQYNVDELWRRYGKWQASDKKTNIAWLHLCEILRKVRFIVTESVMLDLETGARGVISVNV